MHLLFSALLALCVLVCSSGCLTRPPPRRNAYDGTLTASNAAMAKALADFGFGILQENLSSDDALTNYYHAIELEPNLIPLYMRTAKLLIKLDRKIEAVAVLEEACRRNPRNPEAQLGLGQIAQICAETDRAEKAYRQSIKLDPTDRRAYILLATLYISQKDEARALKILDEALNKVKEKVSIFRMLGDLSAKQIGVKRDKTSAHLQRAIAYYEKAYREPQDAFSVAYLRLLADFYLLNRQYKEAIKSFTTIGLHHPDDMQIQRKLALCYIGIGDNDNAVKALKKVILRLPQSAETHFYLGELYEALDDVTTAVNSFKLACEANPSNSKPHLKLALLYTQFEPDKAIQILQTGLKRFPDDDKLLELLAHLYLKQHQNKDALKIFDRMQDLSAKSDKLNLTANFFVSFGTAAWLNKMPKRAGTLYQKAIAIEPDLLEPYVRLAMLYAKQKKKEEACRVMEKAVRAMPDNPDAYYYLGVIHNRVEQYEKALEAFRKVEEMTPTSSLIIFSTAFYFNYGAACERTGKHEQAEKLFTKSIQLDTENADAFNYLAYMWAEKAENLDQAREYVLHALDLEPENGAMLDTLGWIYYQQHLYPQALEQIQNALYFMPDDPLIMDHLGDVLAALNRNTEALACWQESYRLNPDNQALADKLRKHGGDPEKPPAK